MRPSLSSSNVILFVEGAASAFPLGLLYFKSRFKIPPVLDDDDELSVLGISFSEADDGATLRGEAELLFLGDPSVRGEVLIVSKLEKNLTLSLLTGDVTF